MLETTKWPDDVPKRLTSSWLICIPGDQEEIVEIPGGVSDIILAGIFMVVILVAVATMAGVVGFPVVSGISMI